MPKETIYQINYNKMIEKHFINGQSINPIENSIKSIINPSTGEHIKIVPLDDLQSLSNALSNSEQTFNTWKSVPIHKKTKYLINWYKWIEEHKSDFLKLITEENGKTLKDAEGEFERGLEVIQYAISLPPLNLGNTGKVNNNINITSFKEPIGVVVAICPFNFPFMIPLWFIPIAITLGNVIIVKPSEQVPGSVSLLAEGAIKSGIPNGVINVIQGGPEIVNKLIESPITKAISFVGSTKIGKLIYSKACQNMKKIQCNMGAKNHVVITKSANVDTAVKSIIGAAFGGAGQRCMALSVCIIVGDNQNFINKLIQDTKMIKVKEEMGALISQNTITNINQAIDDSIKKGSKILLDKRKDVPKKGNFLGPVIIETNTQSPVYNDELFGPVLAILKVKNLEEAIKLINQNEYGNGTCLYSDSLDESLIFQKNVNIGQIGINLPIPVPPPYFSWSSAKESFIGNNYIYGPQSIDFYTKTKTIMTNQITNDNLNSLYFK